MQAKLISTEDNLQLLERKLKLGFEQRNTDLENKQRQLQASLHNIGHLKAGTGFKKTKDLYLGELRERADHIRILTIDFFSQPTSEQISLLQDFCLALYSEQNAYLLALLKTKPPFIWITNKPALMKASEIVLAQYKEEAKLIENALATDIEIWRRKMEQPRKSTSTQTFNGDNTILVYSNGSEAIVQVGDKNSANRPKGLLKMLADIYTNLKSFFFGGAQ